MKGDKEERCILNATNLQLSIFFCNNKISLKYGIFESISVMNILSKNIQIGGFLIRCQISMDWMKHWKFYNKKLRTYVKPFRNLALKRSLSAKSIISTEFVFTKITSCKIARRQLALTDLTSNQFPIWIIVREIDTHFAKCSSCKLKVCIHCRNDCEPSKNLIRII